MGKNPRKFNFRRETDFQKKTAIFNKVVSYTVSSFNDGYAFECPDIFRQELDQFLEPVIADQIQAIHDMADMERELLERDGRIIMLEAQLAYERALTRIFAQVDDAIDTYINHPEKRELLAEFNALNSMEITAENAADHNRRMREALRKAKDVFDPVERQSKLKKSLNEAVFHVKAAHNDEMIVPLRRMGKSREQREAAFSDWIDRHYGI